MSLKTSEHFGAGAQLFETVEALAQDLVGPGSDFTVRSSMPTMGDFICIDADDDVHIGVRHDVKGDVVLALEGDEVRIGLQDLTQQADRRMSFEKASDRQPYLPRGVRFFRPIGTATEQVYTNRAQESVFVRLNRHGHNSGILGVSKDGITRLSLLNDFRAREFALTCLMAIEEHVNWDNI